MSETISIYRLTYKFVNRQEDIPAEARQVMYYALAVGHHVGVMDCFTALAEVPVDEYAAWLERLPEGAARHKLEGALKWGEIEVNQSHAALLLPVLEDPSLPETAWTALLRDSLHAMQREPAFYLMLRKCI